MQTLLPDFNADPEIESQIIRGLTFTTLEKAQMADVVVTFSSSGNAPEKLGRINLGYYEYEETRIALGDSGRREVVTDYYVKTPIHTLNESSYRINTGAGNGLYVSDGFRAEDHNKDLTLNLLRLLTPEVSFTQNSDLGYAYTSSKPLAQQYVNAVTIWAEKNGKETVVMTNHEVLSNSPLVKIIRMNNLPFSLNQKIIKSSTLPILVTGDGSLSIAIEGKKPFFYAMYAWKRFTADSLRQSFKKFSRYFRQNQPALDHVSSLFDLDITGNRNYENIFLEVMENPVLQKEISKTLEGIVKKDSLVGYIEKDINFSKLIDIPEGISKSTIHEGVRLLWLKHRQSKTTELFFEAVDKDLFNQKMDAKLRVEQFLGLIAIKDYSKEKFVAQFSKALVEGDYALKRYMSSIVVDLHSRLVMESLFHLMSKPAQHEITILLKNIAAQDPMQWGGFTHMAQKTLKNIEAISCRKFYSW